MTSRPSQASAGTGDTARNVAADRLLLAAARHSAGRTTAILLCSTASAAVSLAEPAVIGRALDLLLGHSAKAPFWIAVCVALILTDMLLDAAAALLTGTANARSTAWLRKRALAQLLTTTPHSGSRFAPGDLATRLTANAGEAGTAPATAATALASVLPPLGALVALALIDLWTAAAFVAGVPALLLLLRAFTRGSSVSVTRYQRVQSDIASRLLEALAGARTIAAAGTAGRERDRILAPLPDLTTAGRLMWQVYGRAVARSSVLMPVLVAAVLAVGGVGIAAGRLSVGELLAASRYAALAAGVGAVAGVLGSLVRSRAAARRTAELMALPTIAYGTVPLPDHGTGTGTGTGSVTGTGIGSGSGPFTGTLELRGVTVVREGAHLLRDVDLVVPGGTTAAVVGRSGAGKSTLAAVAGRLTDPDDGHVLLDGVCLDTVEPAALRRAIGYAFERPVLFGGTIGEAIAFGPYAPPADRLRAAARAAGADGFIRLLPRGYDTPVVDAPLSGGELQRLGLARAFAHAGRLLILDDATSSLDTATEQQVERALTRDVRSGTRLVIAHRLSAAARADLVVWLDEGRVRAVGRHEDLWQDAAYRAVFAVSSPTPAPASAPATG
jgi:ATP-binding cassette subfamily B protein